jgi:hypothetical protein
MDMKKRALCFLLVLWWCAVTVGAASAVFHLVVKLNEPMYTIELKEKYGITRTVDSVNIVAEKDGSFTITRAGKLFGIFPRENYSFVVKGQK